METITETEQVHQVPRRASMDCFNNNLLDTVGKALHLVTRTASLPCPEYYATKTAEAKTPPAPRKGEKVRKLPVKDFQLRQSPLTELLEVPHFRTLHHIAMASMMLILLNTLIMDFSDDGVIDLGMQRMLNLLGEVPRTWALILSLHLASIALYPCFSYWAYHRQSIVNKRSRSLFDQLCASLFFVFILSFIFIPGKSLLSNPLPFVSALVATMEQGRLLMKMYAFVRSNAPRALNYHRGKPLTRNNSTMSSIQENSVTNCEEESHNLRNRRSSSGGVEVSADVIGERAKNDSVNYFKVVRRNSWLSCDNDDNLPCPNFTKYLYFLFAPTLVYRDSYPKTNKIRWNYVCWNFAQVVGCFYYGSYILDRYCSASFSEFGKPGNSFSMRDLIQSFFSLMLPGSVTLLLMFFAILHAWQNAFAEMLFFGDRLFYKDWWNCSSFGAYYKTWNVLVHDWLYTYIFKDAWESELGRRWKPLPTVLVFLVSSLFHEYILIVSFHVFFPALMIFFGGFGFIFLFIGKKKENSAIGNFLVWMALMSGTGIIIASYAMEAFARSNCTLDDTQASFFSPRLISCGAITLSWS